MSGRAKLVLATGGCGAVSVLSFWWAGVPLGAVARGAGLGVGFGAAVAAVTLFMAWLLDL